MKKPGYIIVLALLIIAAAVALVTAVVQETFTFNRVARVTVDKTHARMLALSSLELALSQISHLVPQEKEEKEKNESAEQKTKEELEPLQEWLLKVLPLLNKWQKFDLSSDGFDGSVALYIASEQGKINLNGLEPAEKKEKAGEEEAKKEQENKQAAQQQPGKEQPLRFIDGLLKKEKGVSIETALTSFQNQYSRMPEDVTELLRIKSFDKVKDSLFVNQEDIKKPIFLMDLFTFRPEKEKLNPWLFTRSTKNLFEFKEGKDGKITKDLVKKMKPSMNWASDWDTIIAPSVGKKWAQLDPALTTLFASEFEAKAFSVVSYSTVGGVTIKLYALLELTDVGPDFSPKSLVYKVAKIYWL